MILTVTANPSLDTTIELPAALTPGQVHRATLSRRDPGGKGVNISRAIAAAQVETLALLPGDSDDPLLTALTATALPYDAVPVGAPLRGNVTITDPSGLTTKVNEPGPALSPETTRGLIERVLRHAGRASWVALAGSLPPGPPDDFYAQLTHQLRRGTNAPFVAVDASAGALAEAIAAGPELIKPNAEELLELHRHVHGAHSTAALSAEALEANHELAADLVRALQPHGVRAALVTLGARGAVFVPAAAESADSVLFAWGPALTPRSTVGAGDAALAGFLIAHQQGQAPARCLRQAVAHGRAAASLPGSAMPSPTDLRPTDVHVEELHPTMKDDAL